MVKYKCVKEYPGGPELGIIAEQEDDAWFKWYRDSVSYRRFRINEVINYPEFWEEVKENEFLILSVSATKENILYEVGYVDKLTNTHSYTEGVLDGMRILNNKMLFSTGPGGIYIFNMQGNLLAKLVIPEVVTNLVFNDNQNAFYATATNCIYKVEIKEV